MSYGIGRSDDLLVIQYQQTHVCIAYRHGHHAILQSTLSGGKQAFCRHARRTTGRRSLLPLMCFEENWIRVLPFLRRRKLLSICPACRGCGGQSEPFPAVLQHAAHSGSIHRQCSQRDGAPEPRCATAAFSLLAMPTGDSLVARAIGMTDGG